MSGSVLARRVRPEPSGPARRALVAVALAALACLLPAGEVGAQGKKARLAELGRKVREEGWSVGEPRDVRSESAFFTARGKYCAVKTTVSREAARDIREFTDIYLSFFRRIFKSRFKIGGRLNVVVFGHHDELREYYRDVYGRPPGSVRSALYSPSRRETWVTLNGEKRRKKLPLETTKHELTHHMLHFFTGRSSLAPWFTEGAACFFQYLDITEDMKTNIAKNPERAEGGHYGYFPRVIRENFGTPRFVPPDRLMKMSYRDFHTKNPQRERLHYSESWALVYFLTTTPTGQKFFNMIVQALRDGNDMGEVFHPGTLASLEAAWYRHIEKGFFDDSSGAGKKDAKKGGEEKKRRRGKGK